MAVSSAVSKSNTARERLPKAVLYPMRCTTSSATWNGWTWLGNSSSGPT